MSKMQPIGYMPGEGPVVALLRMLQDPEWVEAKLAEFDAARKQANEAIEAYNDVQDVADEAAVEAEAKLEEIASATKVLDEIEQKVKAKDAGCAAWEKVLDERAVQLDLNQKALAGALKQLKEKTAAVKDRNDGVAQIRADLDAQKARLDVREAKLKQATALLV